MTIRDVFHRPLSHWIGVTAILAIAPFIACLGE